METFEQAADSGASAAYRACGRAKFEDTAKVFVAEALSDMVAIQDCGKQFEIIPLGRIEARGVAAVDSLGFSEVGQFAIGRCRISNVAERLQVSGTWQTGTSTA